MRYVTLATLAVATIGIAACDQQAPDRTPTAPDAQVAFAKAIGGQCDDARARLIATEQADLYPKPYLDTAKILFAPVVSNCSPATIETARAYMMTYVQWTIGHTSKQLTPRTGTVYGALLTHWNDVFPYVGYTGDNQPANVPESILDGSGGAAGVITQATPAENREIRTRIAALTLDVQSPTGDQRPHLFVIYPLNNSCLGNTNLRRIGPCYEFASFPHVSPVFDPKIKVGVCQPEGPDHHLTFGALGHRIDTFVEIPNQQTYPTCLDAYSANDGSWSGGVGGILRRLASITGRTFGVKTAYAVHGGLGGLGGGMSPFGGVDLEVFHATFENGTAGLPPDSASPETGTWSPIRVTPPGSVTVQNSLGFSNTGKLVVLNQAGGACKNCGGLLLQGNLIVASGLAPADGGIYEATFVALQNSSNMKAATFKLRDSLKVLAQVSFVVQSNTNKILFNGTPTGVLWVRSTPLAFKVRVDLVTHKASLWINGNPIATATGVDFMDNTTNFTNISADFGGIDSGVMGWDEIQVVRIQDSN
jgi:hypothetical protein